MVAPPPFDGMGVYQSGKASSPPESSVSSSIPNNREEEYAGGRVPLAGGGSQAPEAPQALDAPQASQARSVVSWRQDQDNGIDLIGISLNTSDSQAAQAGSFCSTGSGTGHGPDDILEAPESANHHPLQGAFLVPDTLAVQPARMLLLEDSSVVSHIGTNDHLVISPTSIDLDINTDLNNIGGDNDKDGAPNHH